MKRHKNLLILFYRNPELGKVKTRLAATLGDATALAVYLKLIDHTRRVTLDLPCDKAVYYSHYIDKEDNWPNEKYQKRLQQGEALGDKLSHAVKAGFEAGYKSVCVIGTDCFELTRSIVMDAFDKLNSHDAVIGPAKDGGYYLLGSNQWHPAFFKNKTWSTDTVFNATVANFFESKLTFALLPMLTDVDEEEDLPEEIRNALNP